MGTQNAPQINDLRFKAKNEDGVVLECEALLMFDSPFFGKSYIVYTDGGTDEDGFTNVYASSYNKDTLMVPEDSGFASIDPSPIEDDEEWNIIQEQLERYQQAAGGAEPQDGEDPIPLITELNSGGELEPSFEYRFEDGSTVTFLMELNEEPENELDLVRFSMPASEHERLVNAFLQEQFGGYDPADSGQQRTRQVLEAMVVSRSEDGMCMLEPQQCHVFYKHRNDALQA